MFASTLVSLSASVLITAGTFVSMTSGYAGAATPPAHSRTIDGVPVTRLPGITVYPSSAVSTTRVRSQDMPLLSGLADATATQVANSHLGMPYYSFGSGYGLNGKD